MKAELQNKRTKGNTKAEKSWAGDLVIRESRDPNNLGGPPLAVLLSYYCRTLDWNQSALHHGSTWRIYRFFPHHRPGVASPKNTVSRGFLCSPALSREHLHRFVLRILSTIVCIVIFIIQSIIRIFQACYKPLSRTLPSNKRYVMIQGN